jgi:hypothetical protein
MYTFAPRLYECYVCRIAHRLPEPSLFSHNGPERVDRDGGFALTFPNSKLAAPSQSTIVEGPSGRRFP